MPSHWSPFFCARTLLVVLVFQQYVLATPSLTPPVNTVTTSTESRSGPSGTVTSAPSGSGSSTSTSTETNITSVTTTGAASSTTLFPPLDDVSTCVNNCLQDSIILTNCSSVVDVTCYCAGNSTTTTFENAMVSCVSANCSSSLGSAEELAQRFCDVANGTLTFPIPTVTSTSSLSSTGDSTTSPTATQTTGGVLRHSSMQSWTVVLAVVVVAALSTVA
ncbi:hypothetical protein EXIGLDRAFT_762690 [Exidia glandulosa HHB12029]|uniref:CFEM domain-containing protein n=1 Tax=Exidia glandulosa HHB12029 TaxID=1314781 RepID=A0A165MK95_EXIGL|nr:hypothetical protein EXIGLDRAFT_762690 [Exidia glandulosa HHB12029]